MTAMDLNKPFNRPAWRPGWKKARRTMAIPSDAGCTQQDTPAQEATSMGTGKGPRFVGGRSVADESLALLTVPQVCKMLGVGRTFLYAEIAAGRLRTIRIGRLRRIQRAEVLRYIAERGGRVAHD